MAAPTSLLGQARAFARDFPRDRMPQGYLWDVVDYVPTIIDATLTGRGGWLWGSTAMGGDPETGIYMPFLAGDKLLVQATDGKLYDVGLATPYTATPVAGAMPRGKQNPIRVIDSVVAFDKAAAMVPRLITSAGGVVTIGAVNAAHKFAPVGSMWREFLVTGGAPGETNVIRFANPNLGLQNAASFDANAVYPTALPVTGLAGMRAVILVFHDGAVSRVRGSAPAQGTDQGDLNVEPLFDRAGCIDPLTIAPWNDSVVFADSHGVHVTDGSVIRNLAVQGGIQYFWRALYEHKLTMCASTFLDYYIITVRRDDAVPPVTLVCDLTRRQWFRFTNIPALCYFAASSGIMERIWAGLAGKARLARIGPCFFPTLDTVIQADDDGTPVLPVFETPWYRMGQEGLKRIRFGYLSYDARVPSAVDLHRDDLPASWRYPNEESGIPPAIEPALSLRAVSQVLSLGYIRSPQDVAYTDMGTLPSTQGYSRYRLPLGQFPYGIAFKVAQVVPTSALRIFDLAVEAQGAERSRVR